MPDLIWLKHQPGIQTRRSKEEGSIDDLLLYGVDKTYIDCQSDRSGPNFNGVQKVEQNTLLKSAVYVYCTNNVVVIF